MGKNAEPPHFCIYLFSATDAVLCPTKFQGCFLYRSGCWSIRGRCESMRNDVFLPTVTQVGLHTHAIESHKEVFSFFHMFSL